MTKDKAIWEQCNLSEYLADDAATDCLGHADSNPDAAKDALLIAAGYIRRGETLPGDLAQHLAEAIEAAMAQPVKLRAKALTDELKLTAKNRRPKDDWASIGREVEILINGGCTQEKAFGDIADQYKMSPETVKRYWQIYAQAAFDADCLRQAGSPP